MKSVKNASAHGFVMGDVVLPLLALLPALRFFMDAQMISAPTVNAVITDGKAIISGNFTPATATDLANKIKAGALPFKLDPVTYGNISPTLGQNALLAMGWAAAYRSDGTFNRGGIRLLQRDSFIHNDITRYRRSYPFNRYGR